MTERLSEWGCGGSEGSILLVGRRCGEFGRLEEVCVGWVGKDVRT